MSEFSHVLGSNPQTGAIPQVVVDWLAENLPDSGTSGPGGETIKVGGTQPAEGWWLDNGAAPVVTTITATAPTFTDLAGASSDTYTIPSQTGVVYSVGGSVVTAGTYPGTGSVTVTAAAASGYALTGTASWSHTFSTGTPDTTAPTAGTLTVTGSGDAGTTRTLTVTGASDAVALHATPYRFSTDGGSTWSAYQSAAAFTTAALAAGTYSPRAMVRDAAGNTATATAADFTVTAAATVVTDTFTRADGSGGSLGTADTGQTWLDYDYAAALNPSTGWRIFNNRAQKQGEGSSTIADIAYAADVTVSATLTYSAASPAQAGIVARHSSTGITPSNTYYHARINPSTNVFQLYRFVAGAATLLDSEAFTATPGTTYTLSMTVTEGAGQTDIVATIDGGTTLTATDTTTGRPSGTRVGMRAQDSLFKFDNFSAVEA